MELFETASRMKLRFATPSGTLTVEDLWDLPLTSRAGHANLDDLAKAFNNQLKETQESFVTKTAKKDAEAELSFEIVKHVIGVKLKENQEKQEAANKKERKQKILGILAKKKDQALENASEEDLLKELEAL